MKVFTAVYLVTNEGKQEHEAASLISQFYPDIHYLFKISEEGSSFDLIFGIYIENHRVPLVIAVAQPWLDGSR